MEKAKEDQLVNLVHVIRCDEATALRRFTNVFIIIIIIMFKVQQGWERVIAILQNQAQLKVALA